MSRRTLGELEQQILLVLLHQGEESYAVPIARQLAEMTGRRISPTGAYMVLRRLEKRGFLESRVDAGGPERKGRPRRLFRITRAALPQLRESRSALLSLWKGLEPYLEES